MPNGVRTGARTACATLALVVSGVVLANAGGFRHVIISVPKADYDTIEKAVQKLDGVVNHRFDNVAAVAVTVPAGRLPEVLALAEAQKVFKDVLIQAPQPVEPGAAGRQIKTTSIEADSAAALDVAALSAQPADYLFNNALIGASALHAAGNYGQDVVVAIIDSGTANSPVVPALWYGEQVIGGENFVTDDPVASATSRKNGAHGTWVGTVIAGNVAFGYSNAGSLVSVLKRYAPSAISGACPDAPPVVPCSVPVVGVAPGAKLYALKIFASTGGSAPESRVLAAMDRAITLKRNFNRGMPVTPVAGDGSEDNPYRYDSLNIQVVNMSLGGGTAFAGRDLEDQLTTEMIKEGITIVASAGNEGFAAMTGGSPGSGFGALTVGAASDPAHERVVADLQLGAGAGLLYRPTDFLQTADFSSRGPTADGRFDPELTANGVWTFAQGTCQGRPTCLDGTTLAPVSFVSGTSFSAPTVAGAAALLWRAMPDASAAEIRNALVAGANPRLLGDGSGRIDQGRGFLDVSAALAKLEGGHVSRRIERSIPTESVLFNIMRLGFRPVVFRGDSFSTRLSNLKPGQVAQFFVPADPWTDQFRVSIRNVTPELPPEEQNALFGDDVFVRIADAPTSLWQSPCVLPGTDFCEAFVSADQTITVDNPQTGLVRVALQGDWTNAGTVSADLVIERTRTRQGPPTADGKVSESDLIPVQVEVPAGTAQLVFELAWEGNWSRYPTNDLDLILLDPNFPASPMNVDGATWNSPERVVIDNPTPGIWTAYIQGFTVRRLGHNFRGAFDPFTLRVTADGKRLPAVATD